MDSFSDQDPNRAPKIAPVLAKGRASKAHVGSNTPATILAELERKFPHATLRDPEGEMIDQGYRALSLYCEGLLDYDVDLYDGVWNSLRNIYTALALKSDDAFVLLAATGQWIHLKLDPECAEYLRNRDK